MQEYDLIVVTKEFFPFGQATTNRMICYCSELAKSKRVLLLTFAGPDHKGLNRNADGCFEGIEFHYMGQAYENRRHNVLVRAFLYYSRFVRLYCQLLFRYRAKSILFVNRGIAPALMIKCICKIKNTRLFREISEAPSDVPGRIRRFVARRVNGIYDGIIIIAEGIRRYFDFIPDDKFYTLPMLVDMGRFDSILPDTQQTTDEYFLYASGGNLERDGFLDSLNGFLIFGRKFSNVKLKVATAINAADPYHKKALEIMTSNTGLVEYLGQLPTYRLPELIAGAAGVLMTPHHKYKTFGFPTKLGEYFASSRPVICSTIPDLEAIPGDCAYLVSPNAPDEIADALESIFLEPEKAAKIGARGREFAFSEFTMTNHTAKLIDFLHL